MRTTVEENIRQARWIAERLNQCEGEVRFLLPTGGVWRWMRPDNPSGIRLRMRRCSRR